MKKLTILLLLIRITTCYGQVEIYKTLENYKDNTPEKYTSTKIKFYPDLQNNYIYKPVIEFKEDGKKVKITLSEVWGFKYNGILFRTITSMGNITVGLLSDGKICYWENAVFIFKKVDHFSSGLNDAAYGYAAYFSKDIESDIIIADFRRFLNSNYMYKNIADCVETKFNDEFGYSEKAMKRLDKIYNLGGTDGIAIINYTSLNNSEKELNVLRKCIKDFNGNFNPKIPVKD